MFTLSGGTQPRHATPAPERLAPWNLHVRGQGAYLDQRLDLLTTTTFSPSLYHYLPGLSCVLFLNSIKAAHGVKWIKPLLRHPYSIYAKREKGLGGGWRRPPTCPAPRPGGQVCPITRRGKRTPIELVWMRGKTRIANEIHCREDSISRAGEGRVEVWSRGRGGRGASKNTLQGRVVGRRKLLAR